MSHSAEKFCGGTLQCFINFGYRRVLGINRKKLWKLVDSNLKTTDWEPCCPKPIAVIYFWIGRNHSSTRALTEVKNSKNLLPSLKIKTFKILGWIHAMFFFKNTCIHCVILFFPLQGYTHHQTLTCFPLPLSPLLHITYSPTQRFFRCFPLICFFCILPVTIKGSLFSYFFSKLETTNDAKKFEKVLYLSLNRFEKVYSPHPPSIRKHWYGFKSFLAILRANSFSRKTSSFKSIVITRPRVLTRSVSLILGIAKFFASEGSVTTFCRKFYVPQWRKNSWRSRSLLCFRNFPVAKKFMDKTGGEYQDIPSKLFCLTVPKIFVGNPLVFH